MTVNIIPAVHSRQAAIQSKDIIESLGISIMKKSDQKHEKVRLDTTSIVAGNVFCIELTTIVSKIS